MTQDEQAVVQSVDFARLRKLIQSERRRMVIAVFGLILFLGLVCFSLVNFQAVRDILSAEVLYGFGVSFIASAITFVLVDLVYSRNLEKYTLLSEQVLRMERTQQLMFGIQEYLAVSQAGITFDYDAISFVNNITSKLDRFDELEDTEVRSMYRSLIAAIRQRKISERSLASRKQMLHMFVAQIETELSKDVKGAPIEQTNALIRLKTACEHALEAVDKAILASQKLLSRLRQLRQIVRSKVGGTPVNLTDNDADDLFPTWRPNS